MEMGMAAPLIYYIILYAKSTSTLLRKIGMAPPSLKENGDGTSTLLRNMGGSTSTSLKEDGGFPMDVLWISNWFSMYSNGYM